MITKNLLTCSKTYKKKPYYANIKGKWKIQMPIVHIQEKKHERKK
jgi:hypothetical protein